MKPLTSIGLLASLVLGAAAVASAHQTAGGSNGPQAAPPPPPPPAVKVGDAMPDFTLPYLEPAKDGGRPQQKEVTLSAFKGKQAVVLAFFPAAFSPG
jgi:hypothetical protein